MFTDERTNRLEMGSTKPPGKTRWSCTTSCTGLVIHLCADTASSTEIEESICIVNRVYPD